MPRKIRVLGPWQELVDVLVDIGNVKGSLVFNQYSIEVNEGLRIKPHVISIEE